jgi:hypothetical protein
LHELEQASGGQAEGFQAFVGKLAGIAGSLALILAVVADPDGLLAEVPSTIVGNVAELIQDFILPHGCEFYSGSASSERLQRLASWILTSGKKRLVPSDLTVNVWELRGLGLWDLNARLSPLVAGGWLKPKEPGPTASAWTVNSAVHDLFRKRAEEEQRRKAAITDLLRSRRRKSTQKYHDQKGAA